ncbi:MAG: flagellar filament capping protein FliD [Gammaproteobacteria bacterium]|nr:flagellar filament capping protein FliD [Gammaproteobacteria bacterium]
MAISSIGVGSGLDLSAIISGLLNAERVPTETRLAYKEKDITAELSAFGAVRSTLSLFQGSLDKLQSESLFNNKKTTVSDSSILTVKADEEAKAGSYSVEVSAIAQKQSLATNASTPFTEMTDTIGTGTLTIRFGETSTGPYAFTPDTSKATQTITVSAENNNTTLSGMRDYINDNDFGFEASIVNDGNGYRLLFTSDSTGAKNSMEITVSSDGDGNDADNSGLSQLAFNASAQTSVSQTVSAQDAALSINGLDITRDSNRVSGAIEGVTLDLLKADIGNQIKVEVSDNYVPAENAIQEFVSTYNDLVNNLNTLTAYDAETGAAGILNGDFTIRSITSQLRRQISSTIAELSGDVRLLADIGITTNSGTGTLDIDSTMLSDALKNSPDQVEALFGRQGRPEDSNISYLTANDDTLAGNYAVNITTLATQGSYSSTAVNSLVIDTNNDDFTIKVDGLEASISLSAGTYASGDILAEHIQSQINGNDSIKSSEASVTVSYDAVNNKFDISSASYGSGSSVELTAIDLNSTADLGLSVAVGTDGVDVAGTINGYQATGTGQTLTSDSGDSKGLELLISGGGLGSRGKVSFSSGLAHSLDGVLNQFLESNGLIASRENGLKDSLEDIENQRENLETRLISLEERLIKQYTALDTLIAQFNQTSNFLSQQLANLPKPNSIGNK